MKNQLFASTGRSILSFAHLGGLKSAKAEDTNDESDKEQMPADDQTDQENKGKNGKGGKNADSDTPKDDEEPVTDNDPDGHRTDDGEDDDSDEEMRGKGKTAEARRRERARCAAILAAAHPSQVEAACKLAFQTSQTRAEAIAVLKSLPKAGGADARNVRSDRNPTIATSGSPGAVTRRQAVQSGWDRAIAKANPASHKR